MRSRATLPIDRLFGSAAAVRGCPCGAKGWDSKNRPTVSVMMQLATIGARQRTRGKAVTIHCCEICIRLIHTKRGRKMRHALAMALQSQMVDIARQVKGANAA